MGKIEQKITAELQTLFTYIMDVLTIEYPTDKISVEYIIVATLDNKKTHAYTLLNSYLLTSNLNELRNIYAEFLSKKSKHQFYKKNEKEIVFDEIMQHVFQTVIKEGHKMNTDIIGTEHVMLSILNPQNKLDEVINVFKNVGIDYAFLYDKCTEQMTYKQNEVKNNKINSIMQLKNNNKNHSNQSNVKPTFIEQYTVNLNQLAKKGEIDDLVGREKEINQIIKVLGRRKKNNVVLVGKSGVGKSQIVQGIAVLINQNKVPEILYGKEIVMLNITALVSGTHFRGMFEERINGLFDELKKNRKYILFIDDMQTVLKSSNKEKDTDISGMIGNILNEGSVRVIGAINFKDYRNAIETNSSISRKLQKIVVEPTSIQESINILEKNKFYYEDFHKVKYDSKIIELCVKLSDRYITERSLPDSAFDVLDLSGAQISLLRQESEEILNHRKELDKLKMKKNDLLNNGNFEFIESIEETENYHKKEIAELKRKIETSNEEEYIKITDEHIMSTISDMTDIPIDKLKVNDKEHIVNIDKVLKEQIIGQDEAIEIVCKIIKRNKVGLGNKTKTRGNLLLIGKSGVGKTMLAKKIAEKIYGSEHDLIRIDMSEYAEKSSISKLTGAAPSYVGYENGGQLTEAIKHKPHCVLLLDEIEKAHEEVYNVFLQLFDEGRLTDNSGQMVSFKNVLVLMTSNVGTKQAAEMKGGIGFTTNQTNYEKQIIEKNVKNRFAPEFLNRLDQIVYFNSLSEENLKDIIKIEMNNFIERLQEINFNLKYDDNTINYLHQLSIKEKDYGARPILRIIQNNIEDEITDLILNNDYKENYTFNAKIRNNKLIFE